MELHNLLIRIFSLLLVVAVCGPVGALSAQDTPLLVDPYEIQEFVNREHTSDLAGLWQLLAIPAELATLRWGDEESLAVPRSFTECRNCVAELKQLDPHDQSAAGVILKIYQPWGFCRFLLFSPAGPVEPGRKPQWRLLGYADHDYARYQMPEYRIARLGEQAYFVMTAQVMSGSGISLEYERWYAINPTGVREVLSIPVRGHECADALSLCRSFATEVIGATTDGSLVEVVFRVEYSGNYFLLDGRSFVDLPLFGKEQRVFYARTEPAGEFTPVDRGTKMNQDEIRLVYGIGELTCSDFLRFNSAELARLNAGDDAVIKTWLTRYLADCRQSADGMGRELP